MTQNYGSSTNIWKTENSMNIGMLPDMTTNEDRQIQLEDQIVPQNSNKLASNNQIIKDNKRHLKSLSTENKNSSQSNKVSTLLQQVAAKICKFDDEFERSREIKEQIKWKIQRN